MIPPFGYRPRARLDLMQQFMYLAEGALRSTRAAAALQDSYDSGVARLKDMRRLSGAVWPRWAVINTKHSYD